MRPPLATPNIVALVLGIVAMALTHVACSVALQLMPLTWLVDASGARMEWGAVALVSYAVAGAVVGYWAKRSPLMHGALLGAIIMGMFAGIQLASDPSFTWEDISIFKLVQHTIVAMLACSVGAVLGDRLAKP